MGRQYHAAHMTASFLILETGRPIASMRRHGGFDHWIRVAAGLRASAVDTVDAQSGATLPNPADRIGVIVTGSGAMVSDREAWSERAADWLRDAASELGRRHGEATRAITDQLRVVTG